MHNAARLCDSLTGAAQSFGVRNREKLPQIQNSDNRNTVPANFLQCNLNLKV